MKTKPKRIEETGEFWVYLDDSLRDLSYLDLTDHVLKELKPNGFGEFFMAALKTRVISKIFKKGRYQGEGLYRITYNKVCFLTYRITWKKLPS